jgi:dephospho-CoA kinase
MPGNKIVIGIVGEIASGKGTAAEYLKKKYDGAIFKFSTPLRDVLKRLHLDESRENLQMLSLSLRNCFGDDLFSKVIARDAANSPANLIVTDGIRRPNDIVALAKLSNFHLVAIHADEKTRYERVKARNENANDANKTWEDFQKDAAAETEMTIRDIAAKAEYVISNNGSLEELYQALDEIVDKIK